MFKVHFETKEDCYKFFGELKWFDGYNCNRCHSDVFIQCKQPHSLRCSNYGYDESIIA